MLGWQGIVADGEPCPHSPWGLTGDYVDLPSSMVTVTSPFTIEFWMESEFFAATTQLFFSLDASKALDIFIDSSNYYNVNVNGNDVNTAVKASSGRHHYVVTYDGSTVIRFYVDLVQMLFWPGTIPTLSGTGSLLRYANGSDFPTPAAKFAKLAIYNAILSSSQLQANYGAGNGV
jgi:hypothetical protein